MDNYPIVVENLFSEDVHNDIKNYMNDIVPFLPVEIDSEKFTREYIHNPVSYTHLTLPTKA